MRTRTRSMVFLLVILGVCLAASPAWSDGTLYFGEIFYPGWSDGAVHAVATDGTGLQTILVTGGGLRGLAADPLHEKIYWSDVDADRILRADLDGGQPEEVITNGLSWPMAVALHPTADLLAWGDQTLQLIGTARLDGAGAAPLLSTSFSSGLAIDAVADKLYWTAAISSLHGWILRANLDGTQIDTVVTGVGKPAAIALDTAGGWVYWTDYVYDVVRRARLDGTDVQDLYVVGANLNPDGIAVDPVAGKVYWGQSVEANREIIMCMDLDGGNPEVFLNGAYGIITAIAFIADASSVQTPVSLASATRLWPNPSRGASTLAFALEAGAPLRVSIHAADGRCVAVPCEGFRTAGPQSVVWDGAGRDGLPVSAGVYYWRILAGDRVITRANRRID